MPTKTTPSVDVPKMFATDYSNAELLGNCLSHRKYDQIGAIYLLYCDETKRIYIGSSGNLMKRLREHWSAIDRFKHPNIHLNADVKAHGCESIRYAVLAEIDRSNLRVAEETRAISLATTLDRARIYNYTRRDKCDVDRLKMNADIRDWIDAGALRERVSSSAYLDIVLRKLMTEESAR